jgi:hypothetical protein
MWPQWSRILEGLGRIRLGVRPRTRMAVGDPSAPDARGGTEWKEFLTAEALYQVWGPLDGSPWEPFHAIPLFASLDRLPRERVGPTNPEGIIAPGWEAAGAPGSGGTGGPSSGEAGAGSPEGEGGLSQGVARELWGEDAAEWTRQRQQQRPWVLPSHARPGAPPPPWIDASTWIVLDLPGRWAVEAAAWLVTRAGVQPVCTFDHWPHPSGVLRPEHILAELLRWASTLAAARGRIPGDAPPLWICDCERLGTREGSPGEFDNRYFLDDSILPGPGYLARAGIRRVVYLASRSWDLPTMDLEGCFSDLLAAGLSVDYALISDPSFQLRPFAAPRVPRKPKTSSFRRSAAGGFGTEVPEPSSGGGGG